MTTTTSEQQAGAAARLSSYLSKLSPIPAFPEYTGPYKVGTVDVEIPVADLESPAPTPESAANIHTVLFRIFYPAKPDSTGKRITWLPAPQRHHVSAYTKFMGMGTVLSELVSFLPRHLHYTSIPVLKNAELHTPEPGNARWPTMIFSHGLGGSRNAYSHLAGSLASHGLIVVCPEHRDGSAVTSLVRIPSEQDRFFIRSTRLIVPYNRISHEVKPEIYEAREEQLRIRLWELGLVHAAILAIDRDDAFRNLNTSTPAATLKAFANNMHVREPGSIIFGGHSFGSASMVQFLKSTYYAGSPELEAMEKPLFTPRKDSDLCKQVTEKNVTMLLDMWCFALLARNSAPLFDLPLPVYADVTSAPGGRALLAVESTAFFKWKEHLHVTARVLSPKPSAKVVEPQVFERPSGVRLPEPNFFYVENSAHLSQSDFGILFPRLTKRIFDAEEPERAIRLNLRAQLQLLRANGVPVARTWVGDLIDGAHVGKLGVPGAHGSDKPLEDGLDDDKAIFDRSNKSPVEAWHWIDVVGMGLAEETTPATREDEDPQVNEVEASEPHMEEEIEPSAAATRTLSREGAPAAVNAAA